MSLDKSIAFGKEYRKPYRKAKSVDYSCRNHGSCSHCRENRLVANMKRELSANDRQKDINDPDTTR